MAFFPKIALIGRKRHCQKTAAKLLTGNVLHQGSVGFGKCALRQIKVCSLANRWQFFGGRPSFKRQKKPPCSGGFIFRVVGVGVEPTNSIAGRIYSPHPLTTWIPHRCKIKSITLHILNCLPSFFFKKINFFVKTFFLRLVLH